MMKKSIVGYNTEEVDELIDSLQNQNDALTQKVANLTLQLTTAEIDGGKEKVEESQKHIEELQKKNAELSAALRTASSSQTSQLELEKMRQEIARLKAANSDLTAKLEQRPVAQTQSDEQIGYMFQAVYSHCEDMQNEMVDDMQSRVVKYEKVMAEYNTHMNEVLENTKVKYQEMIQEFSGNLASIFEALDYINSGTETVQSQLQPADEITAELKKKVDVIVHENQKQIKNCLNINEEAKAEQPAEPAVVSPLTELQEKYFNKYTKKTSTANG